MLPDSFGGKSLQKQVQRWSDPLLIDPNDPGPVGQAIIDTVTRFERSLEDFVLVYTTLGEPSVPIMAAERLLDVEAAEWVPALRSALTKAGVPAPVISPAEIGGRVVTVSKTAGEAMVEYYYTKGDVKYSVYAATDDEAAALLAVMP
jgi:hypothetical protein